MSIEHLPASADAAEVAAVLTRDGVVVVDRLVPAATMDRAREELAPYLEATGYGPDIFAGRSTKRTGGLVARSTTCRDLVMHPLVVGSVRNVLAHGTSVQLRNCAHRNRRLAVSLGSAISEGIVARPPPSARA